jgi:hypothetical protein
MVEPQTVEWFSKRAAEFNVDSNVSSSAFCESIASDFQGFDADNVSSVHIPLAEVSDAILNTTAQVGLIARRRVRSAATTV